MEQTLQAVNCSNSTSNWTTTVTATEFVPVLSPFESWQKALIVLVIGVCMVLTITGNILVLVSFIVDRTIRQPSNYFIASLAATDMLIGKGAPRLLQGNLEQGKMEYEEGVQRDLKISRPVVFGIITSLDQIIIFRIWV